MKSYPPCPNRSDEAHCKVVGSISYLNVVPTIEQCQVCTTHPILPQRINGVTCGIAYNAQDKAGLIPDENLLRCIKSEEVLPEKTLAILRQKWVDLHLLHTVPWDAEIVEERYLEWMSDLPVFGCNCAQHWDVITRDNPIEFGSHIKYFFSVWYAHNKVNEKLFKKQVGPLAALIYWNNYHKTNFDRPLME